MVLPSGMPKGLKQSSSLITIGFQVDESAADTFTQGSVDLQLNPLDNEVFVVVAADLNIGSPNTITGTNTQLQAAVTTTSRTALPNLSDSACIAVANKAIRSDAIASVGFQDHSLETPPAMLDYISIIATNDFFVQVQGTNNGTAKSVSGKLYGYRATADAAVYAALVQSEVLSA